VFGVDPRDDLDVRLEARAAQLGRQQLVDLEDPRGAPRAARRAALRAAGVRRTWRAR
jgi:hypothetical protein